MRIVLLILLFLLPGSAYASIFLDNATSGCSNGSTSYNPSNRTCSGGSDTVYTSWNNAISGVSAGSQGSPTVINVRSGTEYDLDRITINKAWTTWQKYSGDSSKPIVDGENATTYEHDAIIRITTNGVTLDGFEIKNGFSGSYTLDWRKRSGVSLGTSGTALCNEGNYSNVTIKNCYFHHIGGNGIRAWRAENLTVQDNELYECERGDLEGYFPNGWGGVISLHCLKSGVTIHGNLLHQNGGEAMNINRCTLGSDASLLIEDNIIWDNAKHPGIFIASGIGITIRNNLVYSTGASRYTADSRLICIGAEYFNMAADFYDSPDEIEIYGNMTVGGKSGISITGIWTGMTVTNVDAYNNTIINPISDGSWANGCISVDEGKSSSVVFKNNSIWSETGAPLYKIAKTGAGDPTFDYNLWSGYPPYSYNRGSNDPTYSAGYPTLSISQYFQKQSWTSIDAGSLSEDDFKLRGTAAYAIDSGTADTFYNSTNMTYSGASPDCGAQEYGDAPQNTNPVAAISSPSGPQSIAVSGSVTFQGSCTDADGDQVSGLWDFDGGATNYSCTQGATPLTCNAGATTFDTEGVYTVTLTCTDSNNGTDVDSVQITVGSPSAPTPYYEWEMEAANVILDDQGNDNLTNNGSITTGGTEPDPPGYGSVGAVLDDATPQYFSLTNANVGNHVCNGTDTDCTIIIAFQADDLQTDYLYSIYQASTGERQLALGLFSGVPNFIWGYDSGDSYQNITISNTFTASEDIIIGLSLDTSAKTYTFLSQDVATGEYFSKTNSDTSLSGTYNVGTSPLTIGTRSDGSAARALDGTIYWVRIYDEALSRSQMEAIFESTTPAGDIDRCFVTEEKVYTTDDTITVRCDLSSSTTVDKSGGTPYIELETGTSDLQCSLQTANGSGIEQLEFQGTVTSGMTTAGGILNATANGIQLNGGSLGGIDDTVATSGPGSIGYESPGASIDTSSAGTTVSMQACDSDGNVITSNVRWVRSQYGYLKVCWGDGVYFNDGPVGDIVIPFSITAGGPINFTYAGTQPSGMGIGNSCWLFETLIESDMEEKSNVTMDAVSDTTHGSTTIINSGGDEVSSYDMPQVEADPTYSVTIKGTAGIVFAAE